MKHLDTYEKIAVIFTSIILLMIVLSCLSYIIIFVGLLIGNTDMVIKVLMINIPTNLMIIMMLLVMDSLMGN